MNETKLVDCRCNQCGMLEELLADADARWGDGVADCPECSGVMQVVPSAPKVRTPNNSVSFLDGHIDDGGAKARDLATMKAKMAARKAAKAGKNPSSEIGLFADQVNKNLRDSKLVDQKTFIPQ